MKTRSILIWLAAVLAAMLLLPALVAAKPVAPAIGKGEVHAYFNFEQQLAPWKPATDSPMHIQYMSLESGSNGCPEMSGWHFARLMTVAKGPTLGVMPPTKYATWSQAAFEVLGPGTRQVAVQWSARWTPHATPYPYPVSDHMAVYVGATPPYKGVQFALPSYNKLTFNWQTYKYVTMLTLPNDFRSPVYIALGWDNAGDSLDVDCVNVNITYPPYTPNP